MFSLHPVAVIGSIYLNRYKYFQVGIDKQRFASRLRGEALVMHPLGTIHPSESGLPGNSPDTRLNCTIRDEAIRLAVKNGVPYGEIDVDQALLVRRERQRL